MPLFCVSSLPLVWHSFPTSTSKHAQSTSSNTPTFYSGPCSSSSAFMATSFSSRYCTSVIQVAPPTESTSWTSSSYWAALASPSRYALSSPCRSQWTMRTCPCRMRTPSSTGCCSNTWVTSDNNNRSRCCRRRMNRDSNSYWEGRTMKQSSRSYCHPMMSKAVRAAIAPGIMKGGHWMR